MKIQEPKIGFQGFEGVKSWLSGVLNDGVATPYVCKKIKNKIIP